MALPSSSSTSRWVYDVFLSFRGEDTRTNFTDHLYAALTRYGIRTFRDDDELERGEEIGPELLKAIENSRFSIIVFSRNYASSSWCLDELAHIIKCRKELGQTVLPVFYDVEPSDVRKQKRSFEEAFAGHEERFKEEIEKLERWRDALRQAANLKGDDVRNGHESMIIDKIVKDISDKLDRKRLSTALNPVGLDSRANTVISLLYDEAIDVRIVGIYGMGGIGKTTIAKEVYNICFPKFEGSCFLKNVRENSDPKGIVHLQNQLLSEILKEKHEKIYIEDRGLKVIEERLCSMRILIVLDDVDKLEQINKILGNYHWLLSGSRIIITTRIKNLLEPSRMYQQYQVEELYKEESLRLLSINAFNQWHPKEEYMEFAESVVRYARGIPLALIVLGSSLSGSSVHVWKSRLEKLRAYPDTNIQKILEISFHSLDDTQKNLFLDIACFFIGKDKDYVISILDGCHDSFAIDGIDTLIKRSLVEIGYYNEFMMHDLIRDMGREIVRQECPKEPGKRSRVWRCEEACDTLTDKTGTNVVEGLSLNQPRFYEFSTKAFRKMKRLRLLQLNKVNLTGSFEHISKRLRWLCWRECPLESMPADLHLENVVALDMRYSSLKQVWEEVEFLEKLKFLNLSHSHKLTRTPNFKGLPSLEVLMLKDCTGLVEVHESIGHLNKLVTLNLRYCRNLKNLPRSICALKSLENLIISYCSKLDELPEELGNMESLVVLEASGTAISRVPKTIAYLKKLTSLSFYGCQPSPSLIERPIFISSLPASLKELDLRYCNLSDGMIPDEFQNLPLLADLNLCDNNFSSLPASIGLLPKLRYLWLSDCKRLQSVPDLQSRSVALHAMGCASLERINLANCNDITALSLDGCHKLVEIEGFFKLEPVGVEIVEELMGTLGLSTEVSLARVHVNMINNLTSTLRIGPLQGLSENGIYSIFLPGGEIPSCFNHQSKGGSITFNVPPLQGRKIVGFIICAVYAWEECSEDYIVCPRIAIINETKIFSWVYDPKVFFFSSKIGEDMIWLSYWWFENQTERDDDEDMSWRFKNEIEEGDELSVSVMITPHIPVKKCGVHLLYRQHDQVDSEIKELAMIPPCSSRHHRRIQYPIGWSSLSKFDGDIRQMVQRDGPIRSINLKIKDLRDICTKKTSKCLLNKYI